MTPAHLPPTFPASGASSSSHTTRERGTRRATSIFERVFMLSSETAYRMVNHERSRVPTPVPPQTVSVAAERSGPPLVPRHERAPVSKVDRGAPAEHSLTTAPQS